MFDSLKIRKFYLREDVQREVIDYSIGRWIAILTSDGKFVRHWRGKGEPLEIKNSEYLKRILLRIPKTRTIYATLNIYKEISAEKLDDKNNIILTTPVFDIDGTLEDFELIKQAAEIIISKLEKYGVYKSIYLKWSGRGMHLHINEKAVSKKILEKYHPLDVAYAVVNFILSKVKDELEKIASKAKGKEREFKVENRVDIKRVFTVPLSFHRFLNYVCVVFKPDQLEDFDLSWAEPDKFRHNPKWREYEEGELDELAEIAIKEEGSYLSKYLSESRSESRRTAKINTPNIKRNIQTSEKIGRFPVMGLLQAARYYLLKGDINKAKSFGLNRAIFYAWAKYYRPRYLISRRRLHGKIIGEEKREKFELVGNEKAPISDRGWFMIGGKEQLPEDFDRNIASKFEQIISFDKAWKAAIEYLKRFPKHVLEDQRLFYEHVYKPVRDNFIEIIEEYIEEDKDGE